MSDGVRETPGTVWARHGSLAVWDQPSVPQTLIHKVKRGTPLQVLGEDERYFHVSVDHGSWGYVVKSAVAHRLEDASAQAYADDVEPDWSVDPSPSIRPKAVWPQIERASFGQRVGAWFLDSSIEVIIGIPIAIALFVTLLPEDYDQADLDRIRLNTSLLTLLAVMCYRWIGNSYGGTLGKLAVGIRVISDKTGRAPGLRVGLRRVLASVPSGLLLGLGYLWAGWDHDVKTWHDKVADTSVIRR